MSHKRWFSAAVASAVVLSSCGTQVNQQNESSPQATSGINSEEQLGLARPAVIPPGFRYEGVAFTASTLPSNPAVYRYYSDSLKSHFYSLLPADGEALRLGFRLEGMVFRAADPGAKDPKGQGRAPVFQLYHPQRKAFLYTASAQEVGLAASQFGYIFQKIAFYAVCASACENAGPSRNNVHRFQHPHGHFLSVTGR